MSSKLRKSPPCPSITSSRSATVRSVRPSRPPNVTCPRTPIEAASDATPRGRGSRCPSADRSSGPLSKSQTGTLASSARWRRRNLKASGIQTPWYSALPTITQLKPESRST